MRCEECREALSARLDGESGPGRTAAADHHLAGCAECAAWWGQAQQLHRSLRIGAAAPVPDLVDAVLAALPPAASRRRAHLALRAVLAVVGAAQVALGAAQFFGMDTGMLPDPADMMSMHLFDEGTAWNLAAGIGLLVVALRPAIAAGLTAVLGSFVLILAAFCVRDLADGMVTISRVASHGVLLVGVVLAVAVWRSGAPRRRREAAGRRPGIDVGSTGADRRVATPEPVPLRPHYGAGGHLRTGAAGDLRDGAAVRAGGRHRAAA